MIKEIILKDFFSFKGEHKVPLNPGVNMLVGINGSGKTSFLNALTFLYQGVDENGTGLEKLIGTWGGFNAIVNAGSDKTPDCFSLTYVFDSNGLKKINPLSPFSQDVFYKITVFPIGDGSNYSLCESLYSKNSKKSKSSFSYIEFRNGVGKISVRDGNGKISYDYDNSTMSAKELVLRQVSDPQRYLPSYVISKAVSQLVTYGKFDTDSLRQPIAPDYSPRLARDGSNLVYLLNTLNNNYTLYYEKIRESLANVNPNFTGIGYNFLGTRLFLSIRERHLSHAIDIVHISDGTLLYMLLMAIFLNPNRGYVIGMDEPETYLHPDMIRSVAGMIKEAAKDSQMIVATHSPLLLNEFELDDLLVFEKDASNATVIKTFSDDEFNKTELLPGQLWLNGQLGGTRW